MGESDTVKIFYCSSHVKLQTRINAMREGQVAMRAYNKGPDLLQLIRDSFAEEITSELRFEGSFRVY